ncbi:unnamed protein product [Caenorhabditis auriculariae]|uniref:DNA replication licensing factor MCM5 n=1 Tax=Caenorhabditis auriculariae TaxID=2777116 RepID=A0A8S1GZ83_9PELO|nr:unnamed protein product [Caenorhabditis auriculariae]
MSNLDDAGLYYQERFFANDGMPDSGRELIAEYKQMISQFRNFIRDFSTGGFGMIYRDELKRNYISGKYHLEINLNHLKMFDEETEEKLRKYPGKVLPALEEAAKTVADEITKPRAAGDEEIRDIQVTLTMDEYPSSIRKVKSGQVSQIVKISGIIVAAAQVRSKATRVTLQCRSCKHTVPDMLVKPGLEGFQLPRTCGAPQAGQMQRCPIDPYVILPDKCVCVDYQTLKLQENPEDVPHGEMPRHLQLFAERYLTDKVAPGNRVTIVGVYSIKKMFQKKADKTLTGIRSPYLRILGIQVETSGPGRSTFEQFTPEEERQFKNLAMQSDVYDVIAKSIAPSIYGSIDIKKSIACLLFGGSRKKLPDGITRRGDINVLLLGDPGTAKSQLLKFVEQVSPIGVYTSGKGSSAAGLTASVIRDPTSRSFIMEGGAMVLADGGVVCIDEFDKMREDDRVAIHEAMEQQTISIAKAGITTTLNSRCSVLAAANSVYGRWDDSRGDENIDFMPTILSRFDMIYIVKDTHDVNKDSTLAKHVIEVHVNASNERDRGAQSVTTVDKNAVYDTDGFLTLTFLKKFVSYARSTCAPRLTKAASEKLVNHYVKMRNPPMSTENFGKNAHRSAIPITVRQLEAIVRICESLAKMELQPFATDKHVEEALRLFRVSTIEAAATGNLAGVEGFTSGEDQEAISRIESQMKKRFAVGTHVSEHLIIQDFVARQHYKESLVKKVISNLIRRGDLQQKMQRKIVRVADIGERPPLCPYQPTHLPFFLRTLSSFPHFSSNIQIATVSSVAESKWEFSTFFGLAAALKEVGPTLTRRVGFVLARGQIPLAGAYPLPTQRYFIRPSHKLSPRLSVQGPRTVTDT